MNVLQRKIQTDTKRLTKNELDFFVTSHDLGRLETYSKSLADYHLIMDLLPTLARLHIQSKINLSGLNSLQSAILIGMGLQYKKVEDLEKELNIPSSQILGLFARIIKKVTKSLHEILEKEYDLDNDKMVDKSKEENMNKDTTENKITPKTADMMDEGMVEAANSGRIISIKR